MTDANLTPATENVQRGALFALATVPIAALAYALLGGFIGIISGIIAIVIPSVANWLYEKGAGAKLSRAGWVPFIVISMVAIIIGILAGLVGTAFAAFSAVGGRGMFGPAFWTTVRNQLTSGDSVFPILLGLGLGVAGIVGVIRGPRAGATALAEPARPSATQPAAQAATPTAPPATPAPNSTSPGIILNGKPLDDDRK